jgi:cobalamin biosynthesis protein CbiD
VPGAVHGRAWTGEGQTMKKIFAGVACAAAIAAAAVVLLPVAAVRVAVGLSRPRGRANTERREAERPRRPEASPAEPREVRG